MKSIEEIKNDVAAKHLFENFEQIKTLIDKGVLTANSIEDILDDVAIEHAKQCCDEPKPFGFGSYCNVEQKRYGGNNEFYCYKVISVIKSNNWVDVPIDARVNKAVNHDTMEDVVTCICMGVSEDTVTRFRLSDVIQSNTPNVVTTK